LTGLGTGGTAEATVLRVVIVETSDAGQEAGSIAVAIEYADWAAFAASDAKSAADAELQALIKGLGSIRKIVSDSTYEELK
jgi:hypothetical protein